MQTMNVSLTARTLPGVLYCSQYDVGREITINLLDEENPFTVPVGSTVEIIATKPSGFGFTQECDYSGSTVTVELTATMTEEWGKFPAELRITKDEEILGTANFTMRVEMSPHQENVVDGDAETALALTLRVDALQKSVNNLIATVTGPMAAPTAADMVEHSKIYVYTGNEAGYIFGNWYYWSGTAWTSGGVYNAIAVATDTTLTISGEAADAKATGDAIDVVQEEIGDLDELDTTDKTDLVSAINEIAGGGGGGGPEPYTSNPAALGTASAGSSSNYSRGDHVHQKPSAADIGAIAAPSSPSNGDFLVYNGSAWVAQTLSAWQGGSY